LNIHALDYSNSQSLDYSPVALSETGAPSETSGAAWGRLDRGPRGPVRPVLRAAYIVSPVSAPANETVDHDDWRLQAELEVPDTPGTLRTVVARLRGVEPDPEVVKEIRQAVPEHVVITHDGKLLFAYAADEATLTAARRAIEAVLEHERVAASMRVSRWDAELDAWQQVDPPPSPEQQRAAASAKRDAEAIETRTLVASSGKLIRTEFEQTMRGWAGQLGLEVSVIEHPHLLTTQVAFTVTGPRRKLDEFARGLRAEDHATIRTESVVMLSPR
jgi:hypothetical protein